MSGIVAALTGRLGQDAAMYSTTDGRPILAFSVAVSDRYRRDGEPVVWVRVACFDDVARQMDGRLHQGDLVECEGKLRVKLWEGEPDLELYAWYVERVSGGRRRPVASDASVVA
jgi:single-stranded DNA-binding protein